MKVPRPAIVDFETLGIEGRPFYPPVPVGVSIKMPGGRAKYYAWGHPTKNNSTWGEARKAMLEAWKCKDGVCFQNAKFDCDVAEVHMDLPMLPWDKIHDTMFLLFLDDPHQRELGLKPSSERLLGMKPEEQDAVCDWLLEHQPIPDVKISKSKQSDHYFGRYIAYAPGDLVGRYANGDTDRTEKLFKLLWKKTVDREMLTSYNRERELMPILLDMERQGVPVDLKRLRADVHMYNAVRQRVSDWIIKKIRAPADINLDSGPQIVKALLEVGMVDEALLGTTPTGKPRSDKESLDAAIVDRQLLGMLRYRTQLNTCLNTFMSKWLETAEHSDGLIFTTWNQVKGDVGTRTGRLSSTPNFQNIPNEFKPIWRHEEPDAKKAKKLPKAPFDLPHLPNVRGYITPFKGEVIIDRDYSQQEPRILAHFDGGSLMERYNAEPWTDFHDFAREELENFGLFYDRKPVKNTNLGLIYGMGVGKLADQNGMTVEEAGNLKDALMLLYPGLKAMYTEMRRRARANEPIRTWGGREYFCEPDKYDEERGRVMQFDYKLVNLLIQGSAADCTKEAIIRFHRAKVKLKKPQWKLILNVHDQLTASVPKPERDAAMKVLQEAMESVEFDVPMLSEGSTTTTNWNELKVYDKKGRRAA